MLRNVRQRNRGYLPHWEAEHATYFVTFRLADSLPKQVLDEIIVRRNRIEAAVRSGRELLAVERISLQKCSSKKIEVYLDAGHGSCALRDHRIADSVVATLKRMHDIQYELLSWCVMPNHVHVAFRPRAGHMLPNIVKAWKAVTARCAKELLRYQGSFWMREYYDRLIRNEDELQRAIDYVLQNSNKAGLRDWPWVWAGD